MKLGRGAGLTRPQPTTWDQTTPQNTWKIQDSQVVSSSLFASVFYSGQNGDFVLSPEGGLDDQTFLDADGVWHNTYVFYRGEARVETGQRRRLLFFRHGQAGPRAEAGIQLSEDQQHLGDRVAGRWVRRACLADLR